METLQKQVSKAQRRLTLQHFLRVGCWSCFITMLLTVFAALANWYWSWGITPWVLLATGFGAGLVLGCVWAFVTRASKLQAAIELDKRFGLKERISSAMSLEERDLDSQAGRALRDDALRRVKNLHVAERFGVSLNRWSALPLAPAVVVLLLAFLLPDIAASDADAKPTTMTPAERKQLTREVRDLEKQLKEKIAKAKDNPALKDAADLFEKLEKDREQLAKNDLSDKKEALVKLNDMSKELENRKQQLEAQEKVKQQLSEIDGLNDGPADELAKSLKDGDLDAAMKQLKDLADKVANGKLSEEDAKKLQAQIEQMKEKIDQTLQKQAQKKADLQKQIQEARQKGDPESQKRAQMLQKQLDQMQAAQQQQQQMMKKMSEQLGECAQCMANGEGEKAGESLAAMAGELGEMQYDAEELGMLSDMSDQLNQMKSQLGMGGNGMGQMRGGNGGEGPGGGYGSEEETTTGFHDSQASTNQENANGIVIGEVDGPNRKGIVREEIKNQMNEVQADSTDPLTNQKLNRATRDHVREYFEQYRKGGK